LAINKSKFISARKTQSNKNKKCTNLDDFQISNVNATEDAKQNSPILVSNLFAGSFSLFCTSLRTLALEMLAKSAAM
jgi:hypothetical protein